MKTKPQNLKPPRERLETLSSVAGRNVIQALVAELLEMEQRVERMERIMRNHLNAQRAVAEGLEK